jgi:nicotinamide-nucleotide amidase
MDTDDSALAALAEEVGRVLAARHWRMAAAESCTGGWIAKLITDVPASSSWLDRGFVTYSNAAKVAMLDVAEATLEVRGAVSEATAREMAVGALKHSDADVVCAVTGIAGPDGGTPAKPIGTVWFAWAARDRAVRAARERFAGDREAVRRQSVVRALRGVLAAARKPPPTPPSDLRLQGGECNSLPPSRAKPPHPLPPSRAKPPHPLPPSRAKGD